MIITHSVENEVEWNRPKQWPELRRHGRVVVGDIELDYAVEHEGQVAAHACERDRNFISTQRQTEKISGLGNNPPTLHPLPNARLQCS
eukprot:SAG31_NODE_959_length_10757_cov_2.260086_5_plen_88_part_00